MNGEVKSDFWERIIFHVDMDAFFASVEQLEHREWRGKPVIVGGAHSARGVVSSASYEARAFGVRSAMPIAHAKRLCPQGIYVDGRHEIYHAYSNRLMELLARFSSQVEPLSIDEAFLDMTGTERLFGLPPIAGEAMRKSIQSELKLTASVGIAPNKFIAKIASDINKPNGLKVVPQEQVQLFLDPLPIERLMGVGPKTAPLFHRAGLITIGDVRKQRVEFLMKTLGETFGRQVHALACGNDARELENYSREKSISHEITFEEDCRNKEFLGTVLLELCDKVTRRARQSNTWGATACLVWRDPDFSRHSCSQTLSIPIQDSQSLFNCIHPMLISLFSMSPLRRFRLIGVRLSGFSDSAGQLSLFGPEKGLKLDKVVDTVRNRFGDKAIKRGRLLGQGESIE